MGAERADVVSVTFDGTVIGGLVRHELIEGEARTATFRPLNGPPVARPLQPDHGRCYLDLVRNHADAGQIKLQNSLRNRTRSTVVITYDGGSTDTFSAFCLSLPSRGSKNQDAPVNTTRATLRIDGAIS